MNSDFISIDNTNDNTMLSEGNSNVQLYNDCDTIIDSSFLSVSCNYSFTSNNKHVFDNVSCIYHCDESLSIAELSEPKGHTQAGFSQLQREHAVNIYSEIANSFNDSYLPVDKSELNDYNGFGNVSNDDHCVDSMFSNIYTNNTQNNSILSSLLMLHSFNDTSIGTTDYTSYNKCLDLSVDCSYSGVTGVNPVHEDLKLLFSGDVQFAPCLQANQDDGDESDVDTEVSLVKSSVSVSSVSCPIISIEKEPTARCNDTYGFLAKYPVVPMCHSFQVFPGNGINWLHQARASILKTGVANYKQARIQVPSKFNFNLWYEHLSDYPDTVIVDYLRFGFPLSVVDKFDTTANDYNHASATKFPNHI